MVNKRAFPVIIIIILAIAAICGYIIISGTDLQNFLNENGLYQQSTYQEDISSAKPDADGVIPENKTASGRVSLKDAIEELYLLNSEGLLTLENTTFHQISGRGAGTDGSAEYWLIGARKNGANILYFYGSESWKTMTWPGPLSEGEIDLSNITTPEELYKKNSETIMKYYMDSNVSTSDIVIDSEICTILIDNGDNVTELKFKTDTGELI